jgi:tripartite-type tricarboxylate transporter receptor subunit TctC
LDAKIPNALTRRACLSLALAAGAGRLARAADYPARAVTLIVPYAAGGTADILARIVAEGLGERLGRSFVVENKPGASGTIGCTAVAKAAKDGHTLLFTAGGPLTIGPHLSNAVQYRTASDFTPIGLASQVASFLVVNAASPITSAAGLVSAGKAEPKKLHFASPGVGTSVHLLAELFRLEAGFEATHVPYRGGAPAVNDLLGGHVDFLFENVPQLLPQVTSGVLRALAVTAPARLASAPDVPTLDEAGFKGIGMGTWYGLLGPSGLPADITGLLARTLGDLLADAAVAKRLADLGIASDFRPTTAFAAFIGEDDARWRSTIARAKIEVPG